MSNMLGRTGPWVQHCCTRHCGKLKMNGKRAKEKKQWQKENKDQVDKVVCR